MRKCSICGCEIIGYGNNTEPINNGRCCDDCNQQVILARLMQIHTDNFYKTLDVTDEEANDMGYDESMFC